MMFLRVFNTFTRALLFTTTLLGPMSSPDGRAHLSDFGLSVVVVEFAGIYYFTSALNGTVRFPKRMAQS